MGDALAVGDAERFADVGDDVVGALEGELLAGRAPFQIAETRSPERRATCRATTPREPGKKSPFSFRISVRNGGIRDGASLSGHARKLPVHGATPSATHRGHDSRTAAATSPRTMASLPVILR